MPLGIARQQAAGSVECFVIANRSENVECLPIDTRGVRDAIRSQQRQAQTPRDLDSRLIPRFLIAMQMALQLDIYIVAPKNPAKPPHTFDSAFHAATAQRMSQRAFIAAGKADKPGRMFGQLFSGDRAFAFRRAQFHARDQTAKILITGPRFCQQRIAKAFNGGNFSPDVCANIIFPRSKMKARRAINPIAIQQPHRRKFKRHSPRHQIFRQGSPLQKTESRSRMKFDVHRVSTKVSSCHPEPL